MVRCVYECAKLLPDRVLDGNRFYRRARKRTSGQQASLEEVCLGTLREINDPAQRDLPPYVEEPRRPRASIRTNLFKLIDEATFQTVD
jgi:hypothetical protein